jgi:hypothetical protein
MQEYVAGPLALYELHLIMIEDGTSDHAVVPISQACLLAEQLRAVQSSSTVRVNAGLSKSAVCYEIGKLLHTLTESDYVFVVSESNDLRLVISIPVADNLVFISPAAIAQVREFELKNADVLFNSRFEARCVSPPPPVVNHERCAV